MIYEHPQSLSRTQLLSHFRQKYAPSQMKHNPTIIVFQIMASSGLWWSLGDYLYCKLYGILSSSAVWYTVMCYYSLSILFARWSFCVLLVVSNYVHVFIILFMMQNGQSWVVKAKGTFQAFCDGLHQIHAKLTWSIWFLLQVFSISNQYIVIR